MTREQVEEENGPRIQTRNEKEEETTRAKQVRKRDSTQRTKVLTTHPVMSCHARCIALLDGSGRTTSGQRMCALKAPEWRDQRPEEMMPLVKVGVSRENGQRTRPLGRGGCDEWPLENALEVEGLSSSNVSPVGVVWWLSGRGGMICSGWTKR